ncbi:precorrin-2 dehydrogenase/sirohydrochlorin ferrochelatase family protein [Tautonia rosea]|uniref:precorrin-2 dehydrogenase/sirohydrochlorin ferrochelatase family protein n=1 Tax=Tautonia rosea TaxID=2728037 RepID=UPI0014728CA3|nr:bifunctional precorrin-2 dehydrogenase/sirohydrochlorin ferrochelatase [Tautonia rosea]
MSGYPMVFHLDGRLAVVVGLGTVGRRKTLGLLEAGARVRGIDPVGWGAEPPENLLIVEESYRHEHLQGAVLVFAAASPEVNTQVVCDAHRQGVFVNSASEPTSGDFSVPATWRSGPILLSISTSGAGPALARTLLDRASDAIGPSAMDHATLLVELRPLVLKRIRKESTRQSLLRAWADLRWLDVWETGGREVVRAELLKMLERVATEE